MDRDLRPILRAGGLSIAKLARNANVAYPTAFWTVAGENPGVQAKTVLRLIEGSKGLLTLEDFAGDKPKDRSHDDASVETPV